MKQFTDITILVDRSGSMETIKNEMESALWEFVEKHAEIKSTKITYIQFDGTNDQEIKLKGVPAYCVEPSDLKINPRGMTPLYDAVGKAIDSTGLRYSEMPEADRPDQVLFVIITDGYENSSRLFRAADVEKRIKEQRNKYSWQFTFLGANQDAILAAKSIGIPADWAINFTANKQGVQGVMNSAIDTTFTYASSVNRGGLLKSYDANDRDKALAIDTTNTK